MTNEESAADDARKSSSVVRRFFVDSIAVPKASNIRLKVVMVTFCIQIQPDRAPGLDLEKVKAICKTLSVDEKLVKRHGTVAGDDEGPYLNLMFETESPAEFWAAFRTGLYEAPETGQAMQQSSMATCTGEHGWDDYLLLYHYDKKLELDRL